MEEGETKTYEILVYLDDGRIFSYCVNSSEKVREHSSAIIQGGYRHNDGKGMFEHYPAHRILKVKCFGMISTNFPDKVQGT